MKKSYKPGARASGSKVTIKYEQKAKKMTAQKARSIDSLALYDQLFHNMLAELQKDIASGLTAQELNKKYASLAAAKTISIALTEQDSGKALTALKDIQDRAHGKATEKKEIKHGLADANEKEIDAVLESKLALLDDGSSDDEQED